LPEAYGFWKSSGVEQLKGTNKTISFLILRHPTFPIHHLAWDCIEVDMTIDARKHERHWFQTLEDLIGVLPEIDCAGIEM
jgi:hypothetical protein